jgi:hypothetical protein
MALPSSNISVAMVKAELGAATNNVGQLCIHPNINKWSKWKPVRHSSKNPLTEAQLTSVGCGLRRDNINDIIYDKPRGGISPYDEPYRLDDFKNYNHLALPPVNVEIINVARVPGTDVPGPPYNLVVGFQYLIEFKLLPGDIDPTWINPNTNRIKNTDPAGGYGGVTWVIGPDSPVQTRQSADVFTCGLFPQTEMQVISIPSLAGTAGIRMEYCRYLGDASGLYETTGYYIEDDGLYNSYRSLFTIRNLNARINATYAYNLWFNTIDNQLYVRIGLINEEDFGINVKIRMIYTHLETSNEYTFNGNAFSLSAGYGAWLAVGPLSGWSVGINTYNVRAWLYLVQPDLNEVELSYVSQTTQPINISTGV